MNTQNDGWIKIEDRKPTCEELPFWVVTPSGVWLWDKSTYPLSVIGLSEKSNIVTHWKPATVPAPPAKEKTQREMDGEAFKKLAEHACPGWTKSGLEIWLAALAYRDKQNAWDVKELFIAPSMTHATSDAIKNLRRRCGLEQ